MCRLAAKVIPLGLETNNSDAARLAGTAVNEAGTREERIVRADGLAQVFPKHKYHIGEVLQRHGHIAGIRATA